MDQTSLLAVCKFATPLLLSSIIKKLIDSFPVISPFGISLGKTNAKTTSTCCFGSLQWYGNKNSKWTHFGLIQGFCSSKRKWMFLAAAAAEDEMEKLNSKD